MAPQAALYLAHDGNEADFFGAVDWFVAQGVDVVSYSCGLFGAYPYDGNGAPHNATNAKIEAARQADPWVNSSGNHADGEAYQATYASHEGIGLALPRRKLVEPLGLPDGGPPLPPRAHLVSTTARRTRPHNRAPRTTRTRASCSAGTARSDRRRFHPRTPVKTGAARQLLFEEIDFTRDGRRPVPPDDPADVGARHRVSESPHLRRELRALQRLAQRECPRRLLRRLHQFDAVDWNGLRPRSPSSSRGPTLGLGRRGERMARSSRIWSVPGRRPRSPATYGARNGQALRPGWRRVLRHFRLDPARGGCAALLARRLPRPRHRRPSAARPRSEAVDLGAAGPDHDDGLRPARCWASTPVQLGRGAARPAACTGRARSDAQPSALATTPQKVSAAPTA